MKTDKNKGLHPRNKHNQNYNFSLLISEYPDLKKHINLNKFGSESIDFANPDAVRSLNSALLKYYYQIHFYRLPKTNLCPPIPGRADYIHYIADLLAKGINGTLPTGSGIKILDIGTGANCIYPILGNKIYGWTFVGTEIDKPAKLTAEKIIEENELTKSITLRLQESKRNILKNIIQPSERFDCVICNPPFHNSREEATKGTTRKLKNLGKTIEGKPVLNFGGQNNELWCEGGEKAFITNMIYESVHFKSQVKWFTSLVSKKEHLKNFETILKKLKATFEIIPMEQGNKTTRILAWRFL
ncbi:23S rRNA (adenine(1618)-N(6))-methyltransferase RlmF [Flavobacterium columnare NBRC 100251 = ATCC 23463]|uniref:23S rRNA (adenine(1618)-N(6))-methyltransferase RlmF n=1 Tax=Flavobacterium columnare TaxID=996 RepID=UPI0007F9ACE4|nr:23S rRNA (adenine(1618)-N(6))-methyltransferase RlmF [Flavobacterium columnare]ANO48260.1 23S rRNA mA1618 methyltransferase [Flavobacterium columnare]APT21187.1 23S rRNA (adenine(1618)-N(6))-methyltransferase [Flavobacterium columnare]PDS22467.1 23S rRNA (adenine(1618)-N(6))-methyltransferase RlmF [Flavobacterium columnare NBRC 100251 = ATCC 23463]QOG88541.1 23S rRNA (adenine(1618)-N(6))-methyltransferase RlmF [Flavobacterium columnare]QOG91201.1 23S rRNA (adenine(1618)-N(6))-methyltransfer